MFTTVQNSLKEEIQDIKDAGLYKNERIITTPQRAEINTQEGSEVLNFCANNYLGLSAHPDIIEAGISTIKSHGFGLSSVRFICGTQDIHKELERKTADFLGMEDCILYAAAFDANGGLFEPLLSKEDAVISDELNHASIIDGIRLCKAQRHRYSHNNMSALEEELNTASSARRRLIVTDGVFSMDGTIAQLDKICDLAEKYDAMVMVDECHATGFIGENGKGSHEYNG
ncbi:MAG: aminotransferase class I/II-fold pyridoxal phosphate-dependent enzyme, partial [Leeuwenhoekiella sp.]